MIAQIMHDYGFKRVSTEGDGIYMGVVNGIDYIIDCSEKPCYVCTKSDGEGYQCCFSDADNLADCLNPHLSLWVSTK